MTQTPPLPIQIGNWQTATKTLGRWGHLGYTTKDGEYTIPPPACHAQWTISAQAPSWVDVVVEESTQVCATTHVVAPFAHPAEAWINDHRIGVLRQAWDITPWVDLPPGHYTLRFEFPYPPEPTRTVWAFRPSFRRNTGRLAVITSGAFARSQLGDALRMLFDSAARCGLHVWVAEPGATFHNFYISKVLKLLELIQSLPACYSHVLYADGVDCLIQSDEEEIIDKLSCVWIGGEDECWPEDNVEWKRQFPRGTHPYPNAGVFGGPREAVVECLEGLVAIHDQWVGGHPLLWAAQLEGPLATPNDDQFLWQLGIVYNRIPAKVDTEWQVFAPVTCTQKSPVPCLIWQWDAGRMCLRNGNSPLVIHVSGRGKPYLSAWDNMMRNRWSCRE